MRKSILPFVAVATLAAGAALAAEQKSRAEQVIEYRESVYTVIGWNIGPLAAAVQGKAPYDKDAFAKQAARIATMAAMLPEGFEKGSYVAGKTEAKPEIWSNKAEFDELLNDLITKSAAFAEVSKTGDLAKIRPAFGELTQTCKACHDKFRQK